MIKVNLSQMKKWKVTSDNVKFYDSIMKLKGKIITLDKRPYIELLCEFNIMFTLN